MSEPRAVYGAVITHDDEDTAATLTLLSYRLQKIVDFVQLYQPTQLAAHRSVQFVVVASVPDLEQVIALYEGQFRQPVPLIIHLISPGDTRDHAANYPHVRIASIRQADLDGMSATLEIDVFERVIRELRANLEGLNPPPAPGG